MGLLPYSYCSSGVLVSFFIFTISYKYTFPSALYLTIIATLNFVFYTITLAPNGMKESLAILKNCFPNGQNAKVANLKHCRPTGIPIIVIHHMHPAKIQASPPISPPNINQRILPIVLMTTSLPCPMSNILLQFSLLSHISL